MAQYKVVIDLGSEYISACLVGDISVKIPAVAAVSLDENKTISAVGVAALSLTRAEAKSVRLVYPILEGAIVDVECAKALFSNLLNRLLPNKSKAFKDISVCVSVPCAMIANDKKAIENCLLGLGVRRVFFVSAPVAAAVSLYKEFRVNHGIIVDIGSECTDIAITFGSQIVAGTSLYHAGKALTNSIIELLRRKYLVTVSFDQAEAYKLNSASLFVNDMSSYNLTGSNINTGRMETLNVSSKETYDTVAEYANIVCKIVESLLSSVPDQVSSTVRQVGVMLCGGGSQLAGLDIYLEEQLGIPVRLAKSPADSGINGAVEYFSK
jgi:rod shape-determining protein MreB